MRKTHDISNDNEVFVQMLGTFDVPVYVLMKKDKDKVIPFSDYYHISLEENNNMLFIQEIKKYKDCDEYVFQEKPFIEVVLDVINKNIRGIFFHNNDKSDYFKELFISYEDIIIYKNDIEIMKYMWEFSKGKIKIPAFINHIIDKTFYLPFDNQNKCIKLKGEDKKTYIPLFLSNERISFWNDNFEYSEPITIMELYKRFNLKTNKLNVVINPKSIVSVAIENDIINEMMSNKVTENIEDIARDTVEYFLNLDEIFMPVASESIDAKNKMGIIPHIEIQNKSSLMLFEKYEQAETYVNRNFINEEDAISNRIYNITPVGCISQSRMKKFLTAWYNIGLRQIVFNIGKQNEMIIPIHKMFDIMYGEDISKQEKTSNEDCIVSVCIGKDIDFLTNEKMKYIKNQIQNKHYNFIADASAQETAYSIRVFMEEAIKKGKNLKTDRGFLNIFHKLYKVLIHKTENQNTNYIMWDDKKDDVAVCGTVINIFLTDEFRNVFNGNNIPYVKISGFDSLIDNIPKGVNTVGILTGLNGNICIDYNSLCSLYCEYQLSKKDKSKFYAYMIYHCGLTMREADDLWSLMILEDKFAYEMNRLIKQYNNCKDEKKPQCEKYFEYKSNNFEKYKEKYKLKENYKVYFEMARDLYKR